MVGVEGMNEEVTVDVLVLHGLGVDIGWCVER